MTIINGVGPCDSDRRYLVGELPADLIRLNEEWVKLARSFIMTNRSPVGYRHDGDRRISGIKLIKEHYGIDLETAKHSYNCGLAQLVNEERVVL